MYDLNKIVILDDDPVFSQLISEWLRRRSKVSRPLVFSSGLEFRQKIKESLDEIAVIIIDYDLKEASNGAEIVREIRSSWEYGELVSIIAVSGKEMSSLRDKFRNSGSDLIFEKDTLEEHGFVDHVLAMYHLAAERHVTAEKISQLEAKIFQLDQKISVTSTAMKEYLFQKGDTPAAALIRQFERNLRD